jgi:hypothetical protein
MFVRKISTFVLLSLFGLAVLAPATASAQGPGEPMEVRRWSYATSSTAGKDQLFRVTVLNPKLIAAEGEPVPAQVDYFLRLQGIDGEATIAPGEAYTFTIDPRLCGELIDPRTGARRVILDLRVEARVPFDAQLVPPVATVDLVNAGSGRVEATPKLFLHAVTATH